MESVSSVEVRSARTVKSRYMVEDGGGETAGLRGSALWGSLERSRNLLKTVVPQIGLRAYRVISKGESLNWLRSYAAFKPKDSVPSNLTRCARIVGAKKN